MVRLAAAVIVVMLGGCGAVDPGRTEGLSLRYERRQEPVGLAIWTVRTDGTIRYAGGRDAVLGRDTWVGALGDPELSAFMTLLRDLPPALAAAPSAGESSEPSPVRTQVDIGGPDGRRRMSAAGDPPALGPLLAWLQTVSRPRLDPVLERLPRPTEPPR